MNRINKNKFLIVAFFLVIAFFCFGKTHHANAYEIPTFLQPFGVFKTVAGFSGAILDKITGHDVSSVINNPISSAFKVILFGVLQFIIMLLTLASTVFNWVIEPSVVLNSLSSDAIYKAWSIVRDLLNVTFIMFLLFSAFATVFQIEKYNYKKTLVMIVIMALLVNFSFPISRFIIDFANLLMYYLVDKLSVGANSLSGDWVINSAKASSLASVLNGNWNASIPSLIAAIVFVFILAITLLIISVLFLIRIIALSILVVFSPLAFIGAAIPPFAKYANDWWNQIFKYAFFGPIMIFMIYLSTELMGMMKAEQVNIVKVASDTSSMPGLMSSYVSLMVPVVILWIGLGMAQSMSIAGAGAITGKAKGFMGWAGKTLTGYRALSWGTKAIVGKEGKVEQMMARNKVLRWVSPTAIQKGWQERSEQKKQEAFGPASGGWRDTFNRVFDKTKTNYKQLKLDQLDATRAKEMKETSQSSSFLLNQAKNLVGVNSESARRDWKATFSILWANRDQDELMGYIKNNLDKPILPGGKTFRELLDIKPGEEEEKTGVSGYNVNQVVKKVLNSCGEDEQQINKFIMDIGEIAAGNEGVGFGGADFDEDGNLVAAKNKWEQASSAISKLVTVEEGQGLVRKLHRNNITSERYDKDGDTIVNPEFSELVRQGVLTSMKEHVTRHNQSFVQQVGDPRTIRGMRKKVQDMYDNGEEHFDRKTGKVIVDKINPEQYKAAMDWIDNFEHYVQTGKKRDQKEKTKEKEEKEEKGKEEEKKTQFVDQHGRPLT